MRAAIPLLAVGAVLLAGCGDTPRGGDPGGRRLQELAHDSVFATRPFGATVVSTTKTKAAYRKPGFESPGWDGPSVVVRFTSAAPPLRVYRFYGARAVAAGWKATAAGSLKVTDRWSKRYADGATGYLSITLLGRPPAGARATYLLSGGISTVAS